MLKFNKKPQTLNELKTKKNKLTKEIAVFDALGTKLFVFGLVFLIAYIASDTYWHFMFDALYGEGVIVGPEKEGLRLAINLTMYVMPLSFLFVSVGLLATGVILGLIGASLKREKNSIETDKLPEVTPHAE